MFSISVGLMVLLLIAAFSARGQGSARLYGKVSDLGSGRGLAGVVIKVFNADTLIGTISDSLGKYRLAAVPFGRYEVAFSLLGYGQKRESELLLTSRSGTELNVFLEEQAVQSATVQILSQQKWGTRNEAALVSGRSFTGEELSRVAGALDDPARVAARFPGVIPSADFSRNAINVRGNPARTVLWRLEGIDIYNPNHFGTQEGASGTVTLFSQRLLARTDFFSGAFPADYGNALGSVFDVRFRNGSREQLRATFQFSVLGIDAALEGPLGKNRRTTFLANYRYSTTGLVAEILPNTGIPTFQDFSFKLHHEFKSGGELNFFGIGGRTDFVVNPVADTAQWDSLIAANSGRQTRSYAGSLGATWTHPLNRKTYLKFAIVGTGSQFHNDGYELDRSLVRDTIRQARTRTNRWSTHVFVNRKFGAVHTHRTGVMAHRMRVNSFIRFPVGVPRRVDTAYVATGNSYLLQFYSRSQFKIGARLRFHAGAHALHFGQTGEWSLEPRVGARYQLDGSQLLALGYGLHSQLEPLYTYLGRVETEPGNWTRQNADLELSKAHHFVLGYQLNFNEHLRFLAEAYCQFVYRLVSAVDRPVSRLGGRDFRFETSELINRGQALTYGIDFSLEQTLHRGYYFLINASLLDASYWDTQSRRFPSQFDVGYSTSLSVGREWQLKLKRGKTRILGLNISGNFTGPQRFTGVDVAASRAEGIVVLDYQNPNGMQQAHLRMIDLGVTYRVSRRKVNTLLTFQLKNILNQSILLGQTYDQQKQLVGGFYSAGILPVIGYRLQI